MKVIYFILQTLYLKNKTISAMCDYLWAASKLIKGPYMFVEQCLNNYECITVSISSENSSLGSESNHRFKYMHVVSECDQM